MDDALFTSNAKLTPYWWDTRTEPEVRRAAAFLRLPMSP